MAAATAGEAVRSKRKAVRADQKEIGKDHSKGQQQRSEKKKKLHENVSCAMIGRHRKMIFK